MTISFFFVGDWLVFEVTLSVNWESIDWVGGRRILRFGCWRLLSDKSGAGGGGSPFPLLLAGC